jgi:hypothetical protein
LIYRTRLESHFQNLTSKVEELQNENQFFEKRVDENTYNKLFEIGNKPGYLYVLTQTNKQTKNPSENHFNPMYGELTLTRFDQNHFTGRQNPFEV